MKLDLDRLLTPTPVSRKPKNGKRRKAAQKRRRIPLDELLGRIGHPTSGDPILEAKGQTDPPPNHQIVVGKVTLPAYRLKVSARDLAALGGVLMVADLPIHAVLRQVVEQHTGPIQRRTIVDAARAAGVFFSTLERGTGKADLTFAAETLPALRKSVSTILASPRLLSSWMSPDVDQVRVFAAMITPEGMERRLF